MRKVVGVAAMVALVAATVTYVVVSASPGGAVDLGAPDSLIYVENGRVGRAPLASPEAGSVGGMSCLRVYSAASTTVCLRTVAIPPSFEAAVYSGNSLEKTIPLDGTPSRARVSRSGRLVAWTVFREGDSYMPAGYFSTTAGIYDRETGVLYGSMEDFTVQGLDSHDRNFWGITFTPDDKGFYATLSTGGKNWLIKGDLATRTLVPLRENVECPSLSPDGTRLAYKKRLNDHWRLHLLDLATNTETPLGDPTEVDDQAAWLDNNTLAYARSPSPGEPPAIYSLPIDGQPRLLKPNATSPAATTGG
ncbi:TolB family protein [Actinokineospora globicatena]|uniref:TolB family protein n=1 Tax=Actinokineospora globicatena TaxID=103729 RepID=UPI0020A2E8C2|nr:hypothetical protein [Actinokineospora globicatena]MCP2305057.1 WD40-like Beta Propeller Repeat [Actinokineospora globicatena]GLW80522.1 TolB-like translocation protein; signal peptide [Actinokineospora globicatena]GLW87350.1 TolB-like translocation protein; signal peptide [Actinokineospora globicatena]